MREAQLAASIAERGAIIGWHVKMQTAASLNDVSKGLETLYMEILNLSRGWNLESTNFKTPNAAAIDLHDPFQKIAVQVTVNATTTKVAKTIKTFESTGLRSRYDELWIVGIAATQQSGLNARSWLTVLKQSAMLSTASLKLEQMEELDDRLARSVKWDRFVQKSDAHCFDIVLSVLDRDAIRHSTQMEGDFDDMLVGLREIKQIVTMGEVHGKKHQAKPAPLYEPEYQEILDAIEITVGEMSSLVKRNRESAFAIAPVAAREVDHLRENLVADVNRFCMDHKHTRRIRIL